MFEFLKSMFGSENEAGEMMTCPTCGAQVSADQKETHAAGHQAEEAGGGTPAQDMGNMGMNAAPAGAGGGGEHDGGDDASAEEGGEDKQAKHEGENHKEKGGGENPNVCEFC